MPSMVGVPRLEERVKLRGRVIPHSLLSEGLKHREGPRGQEDMKGKIHFEAEDGASK